MSYGQYQEDYQSHYVAPNGARREINQDEYGYPPSQPSPESYQPQQQQQPYQSSLNPQYMKQDQHAQSPPISQQSPEYNDNYNDKSQSKTDYYDPYGAPQSAMAAPSFSGDMRENREKSSVEPITEEKLDMSVTSAAEASISEASPLPPPIPTKPTLIDKLRTHLRRYVIYRTPVVVDWLNQPKRFAMLYYFTYHYAPTIIQWMADNASSHNSDTNSQPPQQSISQQQSPNRNRDSRFNRQRRDELPSSSAPVMKVVNSQPTLWQDLSGETCQFIFKMSGALRNLLPASIQSYLKSPIEWDDNEWKQAATAMGIATVVAWAGFSFIYFKRRRQFVQRMDLRFSHQMNADIRLKLIEMYCGTKPLPEDVRPLIIKELIPLLTQKVKNPNYYSLTEPISKIIVIEFSAGNLSYRASNYKHFAIAHCRYRHCATVLCSNQSNSQRVIPQISVESIKSVINHEKIGIPQLRTFDSSITNRKFHTQWCVILCESLRSRFGGEWVVIIAHRAQFRTIRAIPMNATIDGSDIGTTAAVASNLPNEIHSLIDDKLSPPLQSGVDSSVTGDDIDILSNPSQLLSSPQRLPTAYDDDAIISDPDCFTFTLGLPVAWLGWMVVCVRAKY